MFVLAPHIKNAIFLIQLQTEALAIAVIQL
jgi:hypothetical protein